MEEHDAAESSGQLVKALEAVPEVDPAAVAVFGGVIDPETLRFPFSRLPASDARDWSAISGLGGRYRRSIRLRESRIRREGSPQRASADAPMNIRRRAAMLAS
jgi:hypothetical protein